MKVAIFGLGYVGTVCGACLSNDPLNHEVTGVDVSQAKVDLLASGKSPIVETGLDDLIASSQAQGRLTATTDVAQATRAAEVILVCVGTPSRPNGSLNLDHVFAVIRQIGESLRPTTQAASEAPHPTPQTPYPVIVVRSTVLPGTLKRCQAILEESSGLQAGRDFGVGVNPEFLREGSAVRDFRQPPYTLVGTDNDDRAAAVLRDLYAGLGPEVPFIATNLGPAEAIKYVNNSWHALKVAFANEVGALCKALGVDGHAVMDLFCRDAKLNISPTYLKPGFAYGGSCLPKDLAAVAHRAREADVEVPILANVAASNRAHLKRGIDLVQSFGKKKVGMLGLAFKPGTDDLRESPLVELAETLLGRGYKLSIYDPSVNTARLVGANKAYWESHLAHVSEVLAPSMQAVLDQSEVIIVGHNTPEFREAPARLRPDQQIIDLVRLDPTLTTANNYAGIAW